MWVWLKWTCPDVTDRCGKSGPIVVQKGLLRELTRLEPAGKKTVSFVEKNTWGSQNLAGIYINENLAGKKINENVLLLIFGF